MYALGWIAFILGIVLVVASGIAIMAGMLDQHGPGIIAGLIGLVLSVVAIWWGIATVNGY